MSTKVADAYIPITGDPKGYFSALKEAEANTASVASRIKAQFTGVFEGMKAGRFGMLAQDLVTPLGKSVTLSQALKGYWQDLKTDVRSLSARTFEVSIGAAKNALGGLLSSAKSLGSYLGKGFLIGAGIGSFYTLIGAIRDLAGAIPSLIDRGKQWGMVVDDIADATGATAQESSKLAAALSYLGAPASSIVSMLGQIAQKLPTMESQLNAVGAATRDSNGVMLNQVQILQNMRTALSGYADGAQKAAIIQDLARSGLKVFADFMQLSDSAWSKLVEDWQAQGLILSESQRQAAEDAQREANRLQNAWTGLGATLFRTVGPQITGFFSWLSDTVTANAQSIANALSQVISFVIGLAQGLVGATGNLGSFSASIREQAPAASSAEMELATLTGTLGDLEQKQKDGTGSTEALTDAFGAQIEAVDAQTEAVKRLESAQSTLFERALRGITRELDARLALLDAQREELALARQQQDTARDLRDAQEALADAQLRAQEARAPGDNGIVDADKLRDAERAVRDAEERIAQIRLRAQDEDLARQQAAQQKGIDAAKQYVEDVAKLVDDATNRSALANTLKKRETALEAQLTAAKAKGDAEEIANVTARLEAVRTAEQRNQQAIRNGDALDELAKKKALLEQEKAAVRSAASDTLAIQIANTKARMAELQKIIDKEKADNETRKSFLAAYQHQFLSTFGSDEGGLSWAFEQARLAGQRFGSTVNEMLFGKDGKGGIVAGFATLRDLLGTILDLLGKIKPPEINLSGGNVQNEVQQGADELAQWLNLPQDLIARALNAVFGTPIPPGLPGQAEGGIVNRRMLGWMGEVGPEYVIPDRTVAMMDRLFRGPQPAIAAAGASGGPVHIHIEVGGREVLDWIDERLAYRGR